MKEAPIHKTLPIVAQAVGDKHGLTVQVGGHEACTNGQVIMIPSLPEGDAARILSRGFIDHEAAHVRFTDFNVAMDHLTNALEDIRIEDEIGRKYPGSKKNLKDLASHLAQEGTLQVTGREAAVDVFSKYANLTMRRDRLGQDLNGLAEEIERVMEARYGQTRKKVDRILAGEIRSTQDAKERAEKLYKLLKDQEQEQDQGQQSQSGQASDQADDSDSSSGQSGQDSQSGDDAEGAENSSQSSSSKSDSDDESQNGRSDMDSEGSSEEPSEESSEEDQSGQDGEEDGNSEQSGSGSDTSSDDSEEEQSDGGDQARHSRSVSAGRDDGAGQCGADTDTDRNSSDDSGQSEVSSNQGLSPDYDPDEDGSFQGVGEMIREALDAMATQASQGEMSPTMSIPEDSIPVSSEDLAFSVEKAKRSSAKLRKKLKGHLESKRRDAEYASCTGKHFSKKNLHRLGTKDTRVFNRKIERNAPDTAIHILLDTSGSMEINDLLSRALEVGYAIGCALDKIQHVQYAISNFPGRSGDDYVDRIKPFDGKLGAERFAVHACHNTPTPEALWYAAYTLAPRREQRKLVFVVTDGQPQDPDSTVYMDKWLRRHGVEVVGIGIQLPDISNLFRDSIIIQDLEELAPALFKALEKKL